MTSFPFRRLSFTAANPLATTVVSVSLVAIGTAIYLSPSARPHPLALPPAAAAQLKLTAPAPPAPIAPAAGARPVATVRVITKPGKPGKTKFVIGKGTTKVLHAPGRVDVVVLRKPVPHTVVRTVDHVVRVPTPAAGTKHCADFSWQQDAQAAYLANLSDPGALDGATGPDNGDGIACNSLPVDASRPVSVPAHAYQAPMPTAAVKTALVQPSAKYFGVSQNGLPGDSSMFDRLAVQAGKAPSSVGWFSGFDTGYPSSQVRYAWNRGALPVITWMSVAMDPTSGQDSSQFTLTHILNGDLDGYLTRYAGDIVRTDLPVVIRFDHEMNGNWYSWSAGRYGNTPAKYIAAWRHIHDIFQSVGANEQAIWLWAPSRIDNLKPGATTGGATGQTAIEADYPGDGYVDWIGASIYLRSPALGAGYQATFGKTITALEALTGKPVFIPETAAVETDTAAGTDLAALKASWIDNALNGFLADPRIVGFMWFNNSSAAIVNGSPVTNDWRIDSSANALGAFQHGIATTEFAGGTTPDSFVP